MDNVKKGYSVYLANPNLKQDILIYDEISIDPRHKVLSPILNLKDNSAGSFEMTVTPDNAGYSYLKNFKSSIKVYRDQDEIWQGRIISESIDFWNNKKITAEGVLAYLNDTTQLPKKYPTAGINTLRGILQDILTNHNNKPELFSTEKTYEKGCIVSYENSFYKCKSKTKGEWVSSKWTLMGKGFKQFVLDDCPDYNIGSGNDVESFEIEYEKTIESISKLVDIFKLHITLDHGKALDDANKCNINFYENTDIRGNNLNQQVIQFGKNLLDYTKNWDVSELVTAVLPRGKQNQNGEYVTISDINCGSPYITNEYGIQEYGWVEQIVDYPDIEDKQKLLEEATKYINSVQFSNMTIEISVIDYYNITHDIKKDEPIKLLDKVRCVSLIHGLDTEFYVSELSIPLTEPENSKYTLTMDVLEQSITASNNQITLTSQMNSSENDFLKTAKKNAESLINAATNGYITITRTNNDNGTISEALIIANNVDYTKATQYWKWTVGGLGFFRKSSDGQSGDLTMALTADGQIVADFITAGKLNAGIITVGTLKSKNKNVIFDLDVGTFTMNKGSIKLGYTTGDEGETIPKPNPDPHYRFQVDDYGYLKASYGDIGGFTIDSNAIFNDVIKLHKSGIDFYKDDTTNRLGTFGTNNWVTKNYNYTQYKGLNINMDANATYISWGFKERSTSNFYDVKILFTTEDLDSYDYSYTFKANRIHFGADVDVNRCGFVCEDGSTTLKSTFLVDGDDNLQKIRLPFDLIGSNGAVTSSGYLDCYICNGFIMLED